MRVCLLHFVIHSIFVVTEHLDCNAACNRKFLLREQHTSKPKWSGLSVNCRLQVFHYTFYSPSSARASFITIPRASEPWNSPPASRDVAVAALAEAVAVPLPQTHRFRRVVTAQQDLQSGEAAEKHRSNSSHAHHHHHTYTCLHAHTHMKLSI